MEKLEGMSLDLTKLNIEKLKELFPMIDVDGKIDFDMLRTILGDEVDDSREKYQFTWNGKTESIKLAQSPSSATLRPCKEESKDWDTTENLYIEGDNLEVLKQLQKTYYGKVKMIYIDPPYNTGNDFIYKDDFKDSIANYKEQTEQGMSSNPETNGRYHTDWLNMMYPRLILARNLLSDDGVIFISIDDNEIMNLKKICDDIFSEKNFISNFTWIKKKKGSHLSKTVRSMTEYILVYAKKISNVELFGEKAYSDKWQPLAKRTNAKKTLDFNQNILETTLKDGHYDKGIYGNGTSALTFNHKFEVFNNKVITKVSVEGPFVWTQKKLDDELSMGTRVALSSKFGFNVLRSDQNDKIKRPTTILDNKLNIGTNEDAYDETKEIFHRENIMSYPKPTTLLKYIVNTLGYYDKNMIVLDFFSGSSTTAHAVMQLNIEDGGNRKFIMVQIPEKTDEKSEAYKAGYKNICEIGKERIRRAGESIKTEYQKSNPDKEFTTDIGFKVFKLDSTNIKPWENTNKLDIEQLSYLEEVFKKDRNKEDILYEILLKYGLFDMSVSEVDINGKTMYRVGRRYMLVCLEDNINASDIKEVIELSPKVVVFKETGFNNDNDKINAEYNLKKAGIEEIKCI